MARVEKTVFLSYRRTDGAWALSIYGWLTQRGYDVFIDYENIASGAFASAIDENILARAHFLVVLSPTALDRCDKPGDWLRHEVETAMTHGRNIVPIMVDGFSFQADSVVPKLTGLLGHLSAYNGLEVALSTFPGRMQRLADRFLNVALENVVHPPGVKAVQIDADLRTASPEAVRVAKDQQAKAEAAPASEAQPVAQPPVATATVAEPAKAGPPKVFYRSWAFWIKIMLAMVPVVLATALVLRTDWLKRSPEPGSPTDRISRDADYRRKLALDILPSIVRVRVNARTSAGERTITYGTAFFVASNGKVVTAAHVIGKEAATESIEVAGGDGAWHEAVALQIDYALDVAVLQLKSVTQNKTLEAEAAMARLGEELLVLGWPLDAEEPKFFVGRLTSIDGIRSRLSVAIAPGSSGAPVVNASERVVGMIVGGDAQGGIAYFLPAGAFSHAVGWSK